MHENTLAAMKAGRRRWVERMRAAKAAGLIERFPNGRRAKGLPPRSKDRIIARGQRLIEQAIAEMEKTLPAIPEPPWDEQNDAQFWAGNSSGGRCISSGECSIVRTIGATWNSCESSAR